MTSTEAPQSTANEGGNRLAPYFPRLAIEWLATDPGTRHRELEGTIAFVDISGFTKLSEGLARHGKVGAEELTATIGTCFVALLDLAVAYGGRLLKFGGDAQLLYFSGEAHAAASLSGRSRDAPRAADRGTAHRPRPEGAAPDVGRDPLRPVPFLPGRRVPP